MSAWTWNICAVGWLYQLLQLAPSFTVTIAPWSAASGWWWDDRGRPDAVVVVPARRAAKGGEGSCRRRGLPVTNAGRVHDVGIERIDLHFGEVVGPQLGDPRVVTDARPASPASSER